MNLIELNFVKMRFRCRLLSVTLACLTALGASAQLNLPTKQINGEDYYYYKVKSKETVYGISHKLNISQDDILKYNPTALSGLKDKQLLFFPVADFAAKEEPMAQPKAEVPESNEFTHVVKPGETLYGLSKMYGVTTDDIMEQNPEVSEGLKSGQVLRLVRKSQSTIFVTIKPGNTLFSTAKKYNTTVEQIMSENPGISPSNFKAGAMIKVTPNSASPIESVREITKFYPYEIQNGDSFTTIAAAHDVTVEELKSANPDINKPKKGKILYIPVKKTETVLVAPNNESDNSAEKIEQIYNDVHEAKDSGAINVALVLPFMLGDSTPSKTARLFTEFYKGFLLAVNDVRKKTGKSIKIHAYDSEGSLATVRTLLEKEEMMNMDVIFAPDNNEQITEIATFGKENNINVVNAFSTKNESYIDNPRMFHLNVPNIYVNLKVIDWIDSKFADFDIVFLNNEGSESKEIVDRIKSHVGDSRRTLDFTFNSAISSEELGETLVAGRKYLFIPNSGSKKDLLRILPALTAIKSNRTDVEIALLGHPEWSTYLSACRSNMHKIDTYFYSRFFVDTDDGRTKNVTGEYSEWYGESMINAAPQFGLLGYDTGSFFLRAYIDDNSNFSKPVRGFSGIQTDFILERASNWSGFVNKAVYFIRLTPYNTTDKILK